MSTPTSVDERVDKLYENIQANNPPDSLTLFRNVRLLYGFKIQAEISRKVFTNHPAKQVKARQEWTVNKHGFKREDAETLISEVTHWRTSQIERLPIQRGRLGEFEQPCEDLPHVYCKGPRGDKGVLKVYTVTYREDSKLTEFEITEKGLTFTDLVTRVARLLRTSRHQDHVGMNNVLVRRQLAQELLKQRNWQVGRTSATATMPSSKAKTIYS